MSNRYREWGKMGGRPRSITPRMGEIALRLRSEGKSYREVSEVLRNLGFGAISPTAIINWVWEHGEQVETTPKSSDTGHA